MAMEKDTFEITVTVKFRDKTYTITQKYKDEIDHGCNHIANMPDSAKYIGEDIEDMILKEYKKKSIYDV